jgi:hypothetical protein
VLAGYEFEVMASRIAVSTAGVILFGAEMTEIRSGTVRQL